MNDQIIIYQAPDGRANIKVKLEGETVWLTQSQLAELFNTTKQNVSKHIKNILSDGELSADAVVNKKFTTASDGKNYNVDHYNLDMIISLGYRINSKVATSFRIWATQRLKEYMVKGFTLDDERLKDAAGGDYWHELLDRIRDIRSSEKALYRQILDLYTTSIDYDPSSPDTILFFQTAQNKLFYAVNQQTAPEIIFHRADANQQFMGLTTFTGEAPTLKDVKIAKNYLQKDELFRLNRLVSAFFDLAELKAENHQPMHMADWIRELDDFVERYGKGKLLDAGKVSRQRAEAKATKEYRKYQVKTVSPIEKKYLDYLKATQKQLEEHP